MKRIDEIDKSRLRVSFSRAAGQYDEFAMLQKQVADDFFKWIPGESSVDTQPAIMDLGCGTGFASLKIKQLYPQCHLLLADISTDMLHTCLAKFKDQSLISPLCLDAEQLAIADTSLDYLFSSLAIQWCMDLSKTFNAFYSCLKKPGKIFLSTFGPGTLKELKQAWSQVDNYHHVNSFYSQNDIEQFLNDSGFHSINMKAQIYSLYYPDVFALMRELKNIGAHNVLSKRNKNMTTRSDLFRMQQAYQNSSQDKQRLIASYEVIFISAEK